MINAQERMPRVDKVSRGKWKQNNIAIIKTIVVKQIEE